MSTPINCSDSELSTYLLALEEGYLPIYFSAINPSVPSKSTDTASKFLSLGNAIVCFLGSQSSETSESLTEGHGEGSLTSLPADFHARGLAPQEIAADLTIPKADCGPKWPALSVRYDLLTHSWKTHQCLWEEDLPESSVSLPKWGCMRDGVLYPQPTPFGLEEYRNSIMSELEHSFRLPTPTVCGNYNRKGASPTSGDGLNTVLRRLPTPCASDGDKWSNQSRAERIRKGQIVRLPTALAPEGGNGGSMNPAWIEWFMGWPVGWTALEPLEMDKYRQWRDSHGDF